MISFNINWRKPFTMLGGFADTAIAFDYKYAPANFLDYYNKVAPVADAIDKLATLGSCIRPYGYIGKEASAEDDLFNMWARRPNSQQNGIQFRKEALVHFLVTGNNFVEVKYVKDKKKKVVKAITNINPRKITINIKGEEIDYYETTKYSKTVRYSKQLKTQDGFIDTTRYQYEENGYIYDLIQYREMEDSHVDIMTGFGRSRLEPLQDELQLYIQGNLSNKATFKNSLSAKKMLKIDTTKINSGINQEMINQYKDTLIKEFSGVENQGKTIITNLDVNSVDLQNPFMAKDLEFNVGLRRLRVAFYNAYNIQLPLVEGEFTSNSNMKEANLMLYDNGILPILESYYEFNDFNLIKNFNPETKISEIKYVASEIPAIAMRDAQLVNQLSNINAFTKNELREKLGSNAIIGLNAVYIDGNQAPIGEDTNTSDSIGVPLSQVKELREREK
jgi:HK97 family phage portal protein